MRCLSNDKRRCFVFTFFWSRLVVELEAIPRRIPTQRHLADRTVMARVDMPASIWLDACWTTHGTGFVFAIRYFHEWMLLSCIRWQLYIEPLSDRYRRIIFVGTLNKHLWEDVLVMNSPRDAAVRMNLILKGWILNFSRKRGYSCQIVCQPGRYLVYSWNRLWFKLLIVLHNFKYDVNFK